MASASAITESRIVNVAWCCCLPVPSAAVIACALLSLPPCLRWCLAALSFFCCARFAWSLPEGSKRPRFWLPRPRGGGEGISSSIASLSSSTANAFRDERGEGEEERGVLESGERERGEGEGAEGWALPSGRLLLPFPLVGATSVL